MTESWYQTLTQGGESIKCPYMSCSDTQPDWGGRSGIKTKDDTGISKFVRKSPTLQ